MFDRADTLDAHALLVTKWLYTGNGTTMLALRDPAIHVQTEATADTETHDIIYL